jgi:hypothetical protein
MDAITLTFYRFMLAAAKFELAIATSTGRNPENLRQLRDDVAEFSGIVDRIEVLHVH